jgi:3-oxoacyl-[acyl-carrier-protein] synthase II
VTQKFTDNLEPLGLLGVGAVTPVGRELRAIALNVQDAAAKIESAHRVNDQHISDVCVGRRMRRADRFSRMAAVAAQDAWHSAASACEGVPSERVGLIVASGFGPHGRGFRFLDGLLECGDLDALPTDFSHSVHGAAAAYIAELLDLRGPTLSITDFECGFEQAVLLAQCWLNQKTCDRVLVGAVEEVGEVLLHCAARMLEGRDVTPGEGAVFFVLGPNGGSGMARLQAGSGTAKIDLLMVDDPLIPSDQKDKELVSAARITTFSPFFGHSPGSSAFQLLGGLLAMVNHVRAESMVAIDSAATFKPSCNPRTATLLLTKN